MKYHPASELFPMMTDDRFEELVSDIEKNGIRVPVVMCEGMILDGRNRAKACEQLGIEYLTKEYAGNPYEFVWSLNGLRRDLETGQRYLIWKDVIGQSDSWIAAQDKRKEEANDKRSEATKKQRSGEKAGVDAESSRTSKHPSRKEKAKASNTDEGTVSRCDTLSKNRPDISDRVMKGELTLHEVYKIYKAEKNKPRSDHSAEKEQKKAQFNKTNDNIEWAQWSWNPVTGCEYGCSYCYARDIANRFFPEKFKPTFYEDRLQAPQNTKPIKGPGGSAVFVCSMADLFGDWIPNEWIFKIMQEVEKNPQWTFIFLTKNPKRLKSIVWPDNAWIGTTVDTQKRAVTAEKYMADVSAKVRFISCEPMLEEIKFTDMSMIDWLIIGGKSSNSQELEFQPEWKWVWSLTNMAYKAKCKVYWKPNLTVRPREYP